MVTYVVPQAVSEGSHGVRVWTVYVVQDQQIASMDRPDALGIYGASGLVFYHADVQRRKKTERRKFIESAVAVVHEEITRPGEASAFTFLWGRRIRREVVAASLSRIGIWHVGARVGDDSSMLARWVCACRGSFTGEYRICDGLYAKEHEEERGSQTRRSDTRILHDVLKTRAWIQRSREHQREFAEGAGTPLRWPGGNWKAAVYAWPDFAGQGEPEVGC